MFDIIKAAGAMTALIIGAAFATCCPFKGHASYWGLEGKNELENFVWTYLEPYPEVDGLGGYFSFYTNKVGVETTRV